MIQHESNIIKLNQADTRDCLPSFPLPVAIAKRIPASATSANSRSVRSLLGRPAIVSTPLYSPLLLVHQTEAGKSHPLQKRVAFNASIQGSRGQLQLGQFASLTSRLAIMASKRAATSWKHPSNELTLHRSVGLTTVVRKSKHCGVT